MPFGELRKFIDDSLQALSDPDPAADRPGTKEEFLELADLLQEKAEELARETPLPPEPEYVPPPSGSFPISPHAYWYEPPEPLAAAYRKREELRNQLSYTHRKGRGWRYSEQLESDLRVVEQEIAERERAAEQEYKERSAEYDRAQAEYRRSRARRREYQRKVAERQHSINQRKKIVERIRREIEHKTTAGGGVPTTYVHWRLLPPGTLSEDNVRGHYAGLRRRNPGRTYDERRILTALSLGSTRQYEHIGDIEGYVAFEYPYTSSKLLECPLVGNAAYIVHKDWDYWAQRPKQELMESDAVVRIPHQGNWSERIRRELGSPE